MSLWQSPLCIHVPGKSPSQVSQRASHFPPLRLWHRGLALRVTGPKVRARIRERSRYSQTPVFVGRLVASDGGTDIVGSVRWTLQLINIAVWIPCALFGLIASAELLLEGRWADGLVFVGVGLFFATLGGFFIYLAPNERQVETGRLQEEIERVLGGR